MMPATAPARSLPTFSASSAFASATSSLISSWILSRTSSTARPTSEMGGGSVDKALQPPREDEGTGKRAADQHFRALAQRRRLGRRRVSGRQLARGRGGGRRD